MTEVGQGRARAGRPARLALWVGLGTAALVVAWLSPVTGDDWRRIDFADRTLEGFVGKGLEHYRERNGRLAGNTVSYVLMEPLWLRVLAKAAGVVALVAALHRVTGGRSVWHVLLCFAGVILVPAAVFRQSLGWSTGFFYYVPPVIGLVLLVGSLAGRWPGARRADTWPAAATCALLGVLTCLFIEHMTVAALLLALGGLALAGSTRRRPTLAVRGWAVGTVLGTGAMLMSPGLRAVAAGGSGYYGAPGAALGDVMVANYGILTQAFVLANPVLMGILVLACLVPAARRLREGRAWGDLALVLGILLVSGYAVARRLWWHARLSCQEGSPPACDLPLLGVDLAMSLLLLGVLVVSGLRVVPASLRPAWLWLLAATLLMLAPLLLVQPIGPRNLYGPLVTVLGMAVMVASPMVDGHGLMARSWHRGIAVTVVLGVGVLAFVQAANARVAAERVALMQEAVAERRDQVVLPDFPYPRWVHNPDDDTIGYRYHLGRRNDIEIRFARQGEATQGEGDPVSP